MSESLGVYEQPRLKPFGMKLRGRLGEDTGDLKDSTMLNRVQDLAATATDPFSGRRQYETPRFPLVPGWHPLTKLRRDT